ncbi:MAG TPA: hypothetical protein DCZ95_13145 [Verrucomicrobia bacterium]|nr:MAG: hypothetical protein A2X46_11520 [Lentisphaerae bacterium GWF2_57_35]HBA85033.1 hypothetical protein [Verrucomicrobiota bacterium]
MTAHNEEQALDALIAITLRAGCFSEVNEAEINQHMTKPQLNEGESRAYESWHQAVINRVLGKSIVNIQEPTVVEEELFAAMNRKNKDDKHDEETEEELKRLRKKLLDDEQGK